MAMRFPKYLKHLIDTEQYRLVEFANKAGVHASDLSKIISQKRVCGPRMMEQIIMGMNEEDQPQALVCWLRDQIPADLAGLVHVVRSEKSIVQDKPIDIKTVEGSLAVLSKESESNEKVQRLLTSMAAMFVR